MIENFLLNGTSQALFNTDWFLILCFELLTLLIEGTLFNYYFREREKHERATMIGIVVIVNTASFIVGTILWLFITGGK